jgi:hypothetical protein
MNRKLQRSTLALSATFMVLTALLLAGGPTVPPPPANTLATSAPADIGVDGDVVRVQRRHVRRSRAALALPYFSFAQGLRRITGS